MVDFGSAAGDMENDWEEGSLRSVENDSLQVAGEIENEGRAEGLHSEGTTLTPENESLVGSDDTNGSPEEDTRMQSEEDDSYDEADFDLHEYETTSESDESELDGNLELVSIDCKEDYLQLDFLSLGSEEVFKCHFANPDVAYDFYNWYGRMNGFSARRGTIRRNTKGEHVQQTFLCHRQGFRQDRGIPVEMRMRRCKADFRCGCLAKFRVHIDPISQRWYVTCFEDLHNHELVPKEQGGILPGHRKMSDADIMSMNSFMKSGISTPEIFNTFACQSGGYEKVGYGTKNMLNVIAKQRRTEYSDGKNAVEYLRWLGLNDPLMFERHTEDVDHGVENLFWCDGLSRLNYKVFGDVLAFDATYKKNKYRRPVVIFSGVDHHNRTIIFATAIVDNETEQTYVWLLEQFAEAMSGKLPGAVITDGAIAMRNAIRRVFPNAHHRLCAWHMLKLANKRVAIPDFLNKFRTCMLSDYGIGEFKRRWQAMVTHFGLEDHIWVNEMYEKREQWAATYFRGKFFAGFRTTSRCEGFHSHLLKFVRSRHNLTDFVQHFHRCLCYMRFKELEAEFSSGFGDVVLQTNFRSLERSAANLLTKEVYHLFVPVIRLASDMIVTEYRGPTGDSRYKVVQYTMETKAWNVYYDRSLDDFRCSCEKLETYGLPCEHILGVLVFLHITELPNSLVSDRWTKGAKDMCYREGTEASVFWESEVIGRYVCLVESCRELCTLASKSYEDFNIVKSKLATEKQLLKGKYVTHEEGEHGDFGSSACGPAGVSNTRTGRRSRAGPRASAAGLTTKRIIRCTACKVAGHNRLTCPLLRDIDYGNEDQAMDDNCDSTSNEDEDTEYDEEGYD